MAKADPNKAFIPPRSKGKTINSSVAGRANQRVQGAVAAVGEKVSPSPRSGLLAASPRESSRNDLRKVQNMTGARTQTPQAQMHQNSEAKQAELARKGDLVNRK